MTKPIDQERFNAAVMNWISEASSFLCHDVAKNEGGKKIMGRGIVADSCQQCWTAYGRDTTRIESAPEPEKPKFEKKNEPTLGSKLSDVEICRANGWVVDDILMAAGDSDLRVQITGFGKNSLLVRQYDPDNVVWGDEYLLLLRYRDWNRESDEPEAPLDTPDALLAIAECRDLMSEDQQVLRRAADEIVRLRRAAPPAGSVTLTNEEEIERLQRSVIDWKLEAEVHRTRAAAAVAEIARLREAVELTDADRVAIAWAVEVSDSLAECGGAGISPGDVLRGLLARAAKEETR